MSQAQCNSRSRIEQQGMARFDYRFIENAMYVVTQLYLMFLNIIADYSKKNGIDGVARVGFNSKRLMLDLFGWFEVPMIIEW